MKVKPVRGHEQITEDQVGRFLFFEKSQGLPPVLGHQDPETEGVQHLLHHVPAVTWSSTTRTVDPSKRR
jgi:hypothetical protein